jgi:hypothetical protein
LFDCSVKPTRLLLRMNKSVDKHCFASTVSRLVTWIKFWRPRLEKRAARLEGATARQQ